MGKKLGDAKFAWYLLCLPSLWAFLNYCHLQLNHGYNAGTQHSHLEGGLDECTGWTGLS